jgi:hypothetical protein
LFWEIAADVTVAAAKGKHGVPPRPPLPAGKTLERLIAKIRVPSGRRARADTPL